MSMIGKSLAHYEITGQLGKGGMGEVYQAKDTKLGRDVAIKVLPEEFALDPNRIARFQREAKLLASINHPNIAAIYGLEDSGGIQFLVMELIEGDTLADRIKADPIPVEDALKLAIQIAEALEAAHEKGVIHRDLKPANIKVTPEGKVKVLDFGLAKAYAGDTEASDLADSPTLSDVATRQGVILGTAAYMSPEQATGKGVDKRADIWAFGVVLFEMLTGKKLFGGDTVTETIAGVIKSEPEWDALPQELHPRIRFMMERCLKKVPKNRYSGISDARVDLQEVLSDSEGAFAWETPGGKFRTRQRPMTLWATLTVILIAVAGAIAWYLKPSPPPEPKRVMRFTYELPEGQQFTDDIDLAVSPDGSRFVYRTADGLYLRSLDAVDARRIAGTDEHSVQPFFSPDGKWIGYWSENDRKVKKITADGGMPVVLCGTSPYVLGLNWNIDNTIVFSDTLGGGVKRVSADGGTPESLIKGEIVNIGTEGVPIFPQMLPDRKTLLYANAFSTTEVSSMQITTVSLESGERKVLINGTHPRYLSTGHLVYLQGNTGSFSLTAVPFDPDTLEVKGGSVPLIDGLLNVNAFSAAGTMVYVSRPSAATEQETETGVSEATARQLAWVDLEGHEEPIKAPPYVYKNPSISPDGTKAALSFESGGNPDIWVWDFAREIQTRITTDPGQDLTPLWTPDGQKIAFCSVREAVLAKGGIGGICMRAADGTGEVEYFGSVKNRTTFPCTWSADGNSLVAAELGFPDTGSSSLYSVEISMFSTEGDHERTPLIEGNFVQTVPRMSPDGNWLAYSSDKSGRDEVYVRPFPDVSKREWQVSNSGGSCPLWSPDGKTLYYIVGGSEVEAVMAVAVETEPVFNPEKPRLLFRGRYMGVGTQGGMPWDIHPDGKRFLMIKPPGVDAETDSGRKPEALAPQPKINIVLNWFEELKEKVPVEK